MILKKIEEKKNIIRYIILVISLFLSSIVFNLFLRPNRITTGGTSGIAIIMENTLNIRPSLTILIISIILLALSLIFLSKEQTVANIAVTFIYPLFIRITSDVTSITSLEQKDILVICIFVGVLSGILSGTVYKIGFSNGGLTIITQILHKYFHFSISSTTFFINAIVVLIGTIYFGYSTLFYAIIILYIINIVSNKVILGISTNKSIYIISEKSEQIKEYLKNNQNYTFTLIDAVGSFTKDKKEVILAVIPTREYFILTEKTREIDPKVFFIVTDSYQVNMKKYVKKLVNSQNPFNKKK